MMVKQKDICAVLQDGTCRTSAKIREALGSPARNQTNTAIGKLVTHGYIERLEKGCFVITDAGRKALTIGDKAFNSAPKSQRLIGRRTKQRTTRDKIWAAMRMLQTFTYAELELRTGAAYTSLQPYLTALRRAGYLAVLRKIGRDKVYRLVNDTGFQAPQIKHNRRRVFDPNTGEILEVIHAKK